MVHTGHGNNACETERAGKSKGFPLHSSHRSSFKKLSCFCHPTLFLSLSVIVLLIGVKHQSSVPEMTTKSLDKLCLCSTIFRVDLWCMCVPRGRYLLAPHHRSICTRSWWWGATPGWGCVEPVPSFVGLLFYRKNELLRLAHLLSDLNVRKKQNDMNTT